EFTATTDASGRITAVFTATTLDSACVNGIEVLPPSSGTLPWQTANIGADISRLPRQCAARGRQDFDPIYASAIEGCRRKDGGDATGCICRGREFFDHGFVRNTSRGDDVKVRKHSRAVD